MPLTKHELVRSTILSRGTYYTYDAIDVKVSDTGVAPNADGRKIVPAGTIVGGESAPRLTKPDEPVVEKNSADAEGVLLAAVDVTDGYRRGAMLRRGYVDLDALPSAPAAAAIQALPGITFEKKQ